MTFGYLYYKVIHNKSLNFGEFTTIILSKGIISGYLTLVFLLFASANWFIEIWKWQTLVSSFEKINFKTAMKQSLASLTVSLATPNRIGEYGAKALFFSPQNRKKILLLNFYSGAIQMFVTSVFGMMGLFYLLQKFNIALAYESLLVMLVIVSFFLVIGYFFKEKELLLKGLTIKNIIGFFKGLSYSIKLRTILFSVVRYVIFSSLFYGLLLFFGANIEILEAYFLIFAMYLLVSILPSIFILDVVVRGGVAIWVFSFVGVSELTVLSTVFAMWFLNFVLPSLVGSFYVVTYQPTTR